MADGSLIERISTVYSQVATMKMLDQFVQVLYRKFLPRYTIFRHFAHGLCKRIRKYFL
jgi:hypothetical protein